MEQSLHRILGGLFLTVLMIGAQAQTFPSRPGRFIVATQTGSTSDVVARMLTEHLGKSLGQPWVVENRGGGGGNIGLSVAAKAAPDGHTLVFGSLGGSIVNPLIYTGLDFDAEKDFDAVAFVAGVPYVIVVPTDHPAKTFADLLAMARAKPGGINVALDTTAVRVAHALLDRSANIKTFPVSYNGPALAQTDLVGGRVDVMIETPGVMRQLIIGGKARALAVTTQTSTPLMPGVAAIAEQGVPSFGEYTGWIGAVAPRGTPVNVINLLNVEINKFLNLPDTKARFLTLGFFTRTESPQQFAAFMNAERARFGPIIKAAGIKPD